ncbi:MAG TPA: orotidine-5'-phosphate decarboxylase [Verrucomicrobiae bacterium]|nr:orotidine-5'-phosphate decarboxylase [Verrucomicrobiae bacterium]
MKSKLIVALDVPSYEEAVSLVRILGDAVSIFKVGSQLFTRVGPRIVEFLNREGKQCFLDLKFHDIPSVVTKAVEAAATVGVHMLTVHTCGGEEMLKAAAAVSNRPLLLGVTVLTSVAGDVRQEVAQRATLAQEYGLDGVVASPHEVGWTREATDETFIIVTPGIRPKWAEVGDQRRVTTPAEAIAAGANYIVVGRPILAAKDPVQAAQRVIDEMASAQKSA